MIYNERHKTHDYLYIDDHIYTIDSAVFMYIYVYRSNYIQVIAYQSMIISSNYEGPVIRVVLI